MRLLVVTAVAPERDHIACGLRGLGEAEESGFPGHQLHRLPGTGLLSADLLAAGVGPGAAAAGTAAALTSAFLRNEAYDLVIAAGIGGGFPEVAPLGSVVVADAIVAADLGAESAAGFLPVEKLGFGTSVHHPPQPLTVRAARELSAVTGHILTVSTTTGSARSAHDLAERYPGAAAEAMEGFGVAEAASAHGVSVMEIRAISNPVGPRDRAAWRIPEALTALTHTFIRLRRVLEQEAVER